MRGSCNEGILGKEFEQLFEYGENIARISHGSPREISLQPSATHKTYKLFKFQNALVLLSIILLLLVDFLIGSDSLITSNRDCELQVAQVKSSGSLTPRS